MSLPVAPDTKWHFDEESPSRGGKKQEEWTQHFWGRKHLYYRHTF